MRHLIGNDVGPGGTEVVDVRRLPPPVTEMWDWQLRALCRTLDESIFFHPDRERGPSRSQRDELALAVCRRCPVITQCRTHALTAREPYGVWGGMTAEERLTAVKS
jgi:WhiB family redox-sensing transcriptional regulator